MRFTPKQRLFEEFRLLSTLKRPKMLIEATEYDACFVSVFKSLCFYLSTLEKECFQNAPFSEAFSKASVFISVSCRFSVDVRRCVFKWTQISHCQAVGYEITYAGPCSFTDSLKWFFFPFSLPASIERFMNELIKQKVPSNIVQDDPASNQPEGYPCGPTWTQNGWNYSQMSPCNVPYQNPPGWKRGWVTRKITNLKLWYA